MPWAAAVVAIAAGLLLRALTARRYARARSARLPRGPNGIIMGAGAIDLPGTPGTRPPAALLLHGFGDTPQTLAHLATHLHDRGWAVRVPLLPGHGRTLREWARTRAADWLSAASEELATLRRQHDAVALVGLSMGGALATVLAAREPPPASGPERDAPAARIVALALVAPYLAMAWWMRALARLHSVIAPIVPYAKGGDRPSILDPDERERNLAYGVATPRLVHELAHVVRDARAALPSVRMPALLVQSRHDNRIPPAVAEWAFANLGSTDKRLEWIDHGGHVITVDHGREEVVACVGDWLDGHLPARA